MADAVENSAPTAVHNSPLQALQLTLDALLLCTAPRNRRVQVLAAVDAARAALAAPTPEWTNEALEALARDVGLVPRTTVGRAPGGGMRWGLRGEDLRAFIVAVTRAHGSPVSAEPAGSMFSKEDAIAWGERHDLGLGFHNGLWEAFEDAATLFHERLKLPQREAIQVGMALVPKRMTQAMRDVTDTEGWTWEDLLAAAEAISEDEYEQLAAAPAPQPESAIVEAVARVVTAPTGPAADDLLTGSGA